MTKVYLLTIAVVDHDDLGIDGIKSIIKHDTDLTVIVVGEGQIKEIDYDDDHQINQIDEQEEAVKNLFGLTK